MATALSAVPFAVASLHYPAADSFESSRHLECQEMTGFSGLSPLTASEMKPTFGRHPLPFDLGLGEPFFLMALCINSALPGELHHDTVPPFIPKSGYPRIVAPQTKPPLEP